MIRRRPDGSYRCDGRECGYSIAVYECTVGDGEPVEVIVACLDCGSTMDVAPLPRLCPEITCAP